MVEKVNDDGIARDTKLRHELDAMTNKIDQFVEMVKASGPPSLAPPPGIGTDDVHRMANKFDEMIAKFNLLDKHAAQTVQRLADLEAKSSYVSNSVQEVQGRRRASLSV